MSKVLSATQMQAVFSEKKPNCLILDEIDGLTGGEKGAIKELLKVINAKDKKKAKAGYVHRHAIASTQSAVSSSSATHGAHRSSTLRQTDDGEQGKGKGKKGRQDAVESSPKLKKGSSVLDLGKIGRKKKAPSASDLKSSLTPSGKLRR
jgi:chromosome transmission fidelity protein 18